MEQDILELQKVIDEICDQMCLAVKGEFGFIINAQTQNESIQKLTMLINFVLDNANRALSDIKEKNERLTELDKLKSDFMANISHELRTPLTLIMGPLETTLKNTPETNVEARENLYRMQRNAHRLYVLVNDLLDFTKLEANKFTLHEECIPVVQVFSQLVDDAQGLAKERGIDLIFSQAGVADFLWFDQKIIEKVLLNLISNALKFTPAGGRIEVTLTQKAEKLILTVADTGIGIPANQIEHIFERFRQVDSSTTRAYEGTGIGLALVKQLITLMKGEITVESVEEKGTKFIITLPARVPDEQTTDKTIAHNPNTISKNIFSLQPVNIKSQTKVQGRLPLVLVVDDNPDMQAYIASFLSPIYEVITADNGKSALDMVYQYQPQVVLSDIMMPIIDGYQLTKAIKENPSTKDIPVILITAKAGKEVLLDSLNIGANDYLAKPFSPEELVARTNAAFRMRQEHLKNLELNEQLVSLARRAGMADIATFVLHNIGNVLNSANVAVGVLKESMTRPFYTNLMATFDLIKMNQHDLSTYLARDEKGKLIPDYLVALANEIDHERSNNESEVQRLSQLIQHIGEIIATQQSISGVTSGMSEKIFLPDLVQRAIEMYRSTTVKKEIQIINDFKCNLFLTVDKAKVLQILINLIQNATDALAHHDCKIFDKKILIHGVQEAEVCVDIIVKDNGIGILPENLTKIFSFGFTTKVGGHGFGLHSSAITAKELGGSLQAKSAGLGRGAEFVLTLPLN